MTSTIVVFPLHYLLTGKQTGSAQMPAARVSATRRIVPRRVHVTGVPRVHVVSTLGCARVRPYALQSRCLREVAWRCNE
jgi:hypothetical protein